MNDKNYKNAVILQLCALIAIVVISCVILISIGINSQNASVAATQKIANSVLSDLRNMNVTIVQEDASVQVNPTIIYNPQNETAFLSYLKQFNITTVLTSQGAYEGQLLIKGYTSNYFTEVRYLIENQRIFAW